MNGIDEEMTGAAHTHPLARAHGHHLAYHKHEGGRLPGVIFLGGFNSAMSGQKVTALHAWAARTNHGFVRFDYYGHGQSSGLFQDGTVSLWREDALCVLDALTDGPQVLVGSSMGAWIAALAALARPQRIKALVLIAPALDFTERLLWQRLPDCARHAILHKGVWMRPSAYGPEPYPITRQLIEDGRKHLLLDAEIAIDVPVRILQGMADPDVPWPQALITAERLRSRDVEVELIKAGDHRLSDAPSLARIERMVEGVL